MPIIGFDQAITAVRRMILLLLSEKTRKSGEVMENPEILSPPPLQGETTQGGGGHDAKSGDSPENRET